MDRQRKRTRDAQHLDRYVNQIIIYLLAGCQSETLLLVLDVESGSVCLDKLRWIGKCVVYVTCVTCSAGICRVRLNGLP